MTRQEWLAWRKNGIGASDAPIIMGVSPWKTPLELYEEKVADTVAEEDENYAQKIGNQIEPKVRSLFSLLRGEDYEVKLVEMEQYPFIRASLDGACGDSILEIKLSGKDDWGNLPEKYLPQVQHQLMVTGATRCWYVAHKYGKEVSSESLHIIEVLPDFVYQKKLLVELVTFWKENVLKRKPPMLSDKDYKNLKGLFAECRRWKTLKKKLEEVESELEKVREEILDAAKKENHPRLICNGIKILQSSRIGNIDYKKVPELKGVDLDQYRGKGSVTWRIEVEDDKLD